MTKDNLFRIETTEQPVQFLVFCFLVYAGCLLTRKKQYNVSANLDNFPSEVDTVHSHPQLLLPLTLQPFNNKQPTIHKNVQKKNTITKLDFNRQD